MRRDSSRALTLVEAYRMRWKRRRLLWRSFRSRWKLKKIKDGTSAIEFDDVLLFATVRNEIERIEVFLTHYRQLGVSHFLIVDNSSDDGTRELLESQQDVSLWTTNASYRSSRFGLDWITWLMIKHGHGHWCVTVDADELLAYVGSDQIKLGDLASSLEADGRQAFGALMLDMYPKGSIGTEEAGALEWFDPGPYRAVRQRPLLNLWVQGGARERVFFKDTPSQSPTLNKLPFVRWNWRYCYVNSTHSMLPPALNLTYDGPGIEQPSGVLFHTKFMPSIVSKSETERRRAQHFTSPEKFNDYYEKIAAQPDMWTEASVQYEGPEQLAEMGLIGSITKP